MFTRIAFAIGALTYYFGAKYGSSVNYAQGKNAHGQVEFAFDINRASKRRLAPYDYILDWFGDRL